MENDSLEKPQKAGTLPLEVREAYKEYIEVLRDFKNKKKFKENLNLMMQIRGFKTQKEFAESISCHHVNFSRICNGPEKFTVTLLYRICKQLEVHPSLMCFCDLSDLISEYIKRISYANQ